MPAHEILHKKTYHVSARPTRRIKTTPTVKIFRTPSNKNLQLSNGSTTMAKSTPQSGKHKTNTSPTSGDSKESIGGGFVVGDEALVAGKGSHEGATIMRTEMRKF